MNNLTDEQRAWYILQGYDIIINRYGDREWRINGKRHREDGPAVEYPNGTRFWYLNGKLHREDGPAVEYPNGYKEWWINGRHILPHD